MNLRFRANQPCCMIDSNAANVWTTMMTFIRRHDPEMERLEDKFRAEGDFLYLGQSPVGVVDDKPDTDPRQSWTYDGVRYRTNDSLLKLGIFSAMGVVNRTYPDVYMVDTTPIGFAHYTAD